MMILSIENEKIRCPECDTDCDKVLHLGFDRKRLPISLCLPCLRKAVEMLKQAMAGDVSKTRPNCDTSCRRV
jgi:hypothetical protein